MKKIITVILLIIMSASFGTIASASGNAPIINVQPQSPVYPEFAGAEYSVEVFGEDLYCDWYLEFQGKFYLVSDTEGPTDPWEYYAGETYGCYPEVEISEQVTKFTFFFGGIGKELDGARIFAVVQNKHGSVESSKAVINVSEDAAMPPTIFLFTPQLEVFKGDEAILYCLAQTYNGQTPTYTWYETHSGNLADIIAIQDADSTTGTFTCDTSECKTRYYVCMVTSPDGGAAYTNVTPVTVSERPQGFEPPEFLTESISPATVGEQYSFKLECSDAEAEYFIYYNPGRPNDFDKTGLKLLDDGTISGTPAAEGEYTFTVCAYVRASGGNHLLPMSLRQAHIPGS